MASGQNVRQEICSQFQQQNFLRTIILIHVIFQRASKRTGIKTHNGTILWQSTLQHDRESKFYKYSEFVVRS
jgi:hypothetical protein